MDRAYTGHVVPAEWRWVILLSVISLLVIFSPLLAIVILNPPNQNWQFMGALHDFHDTATSLTRIRQGVEGQFLVPFQYTPESNPAVLVHPLYPLLGHLARITAVSPILMFHLARVFSALFMFLAIYQLGANIWVKIRTRRIFFVIAVTGSGIGWLYTLLNRFSLSEVIPELQYPMIYPLYSAAANVHYPLTIACLSLIVANLIPILRPGEAAPPTVANGGLTVFITGLILAFLFPDALIPMGIAYIITTIARWRDLRKASMREFYWGLWILVPALPVLAYDLLVLNANSYVANWVMQRGDAMPALHMLIFSIAIPLLLALPGFYRAATRFEPDGDRFMLIWFFAMIVVMYLPVSLEQYALAGLMLPVAYFATRSLEDVWFNYIRRRYRLRFYVVGLIVMAMGHAIWLYLPALPIIHNWSNASASVLNRDYYAAFTLLDSQLGSSDVVLAAPSVGIWVPFHAGTRVVYGHPAETYMSEQKRSEVVEWYTTGDPSACNALLDQYRVSYVVYGIYERQLGTGICLQELTLVTQLGDVALYATTYAVSPQGGSN